MTVDCNEALETSVSARLCTNAIAMCLFTNQRPATAQPGIAADRFAREIRAILERDTTRSRRLMRNPFGLQRKCCRDAKRQYCYLACLVPFAGFQAATMIACVGVRK
jgi:hypothetical protein